MISDDTKHVPKIFLLIYTKVKLTCHWLVSTIKLSLACITKFVTVVLLIIKLCV